MKILLFLMVMIVLLVRNISLTRKIRRINKRLGESESRFRDKYVDDGYEGY